MVVSSSVALDGLWMRVQPKNSWLARGTVTRWSDRCGVAGGFVTASSVYAAESCLLSEATR